MYGSQRLRPSAVCLPTFFKNNFFCVQQKKETPGLGQLEGEQIITELSFLGELSY